MKSIERRYNNIAEKNPRWSSIIAFTAAIKGQGFSHQLIHRWFNKLVEKGDYSQADKLDIFSYLEKISIRPEANHFLG